MTISGRFFGDAPYFRVYLRHPRFEGEAWLLADIGASRTALLNRDVKLLRIPADIIEMTPSRTVGVGGSMRTSVIHDVELTLKSNVGRYKWRQDVAVVRHALSRLSVEERKRMERLPSLLGRDFINRFRFIYDFGKGIVQLIR